MGVVARTRQGVGEAIPGMGTWQSRQQVGPPLPASQPASSQSACRYAISLLGISVRLLDIMHVVGLIPTTGLVPIGQ